MAQDRQRECVRGLASICCTPPSASNLCFAFASVPSWLSAGGYVDLDRMAAGMDVDVAAGVEIRGTLRGRMDVPEVQHWKLVESHGLQTLCECHERYCGCPADHNPGEDRSPREDDSWCGQRRAYLSCKKVLEKELVRHQKKLNGPKNTAKHIGAKQNWINRESKRIEAESAKRAEMQQKLRVRKETLSVAYEEINILRADLLREGESMDKNRSHIMNCSEVTCWMDETRIDRGDRQLDDGSTVTLTRKLQEAIEKNPQ